MTKTLKILFAFVISPLPPLMFGLIWIMLSIVAYALGYFGDLGLGGLFISSFLGHLITCLTWLILAFLLCLFLERRQTA